MTRRRLTSLLALSLALLLTSCSAPSAPPPPSRVDLEGLWLVTPGPDTTYGSGGLTTLEFHGASGTAEYLSRAAASGVMTCERQVFAVLTDKVVLLDGTYYEATASGDTIVLENGVDSLTLTRVTGAPPLERCREVEAVVLAEAEQDYGAFSTLDVVGDHLYLNVTVGSSERFVYYDISEGRFSPLRTYEPGGGGQYRWVVAAETDQRFYVHCGCGAGTDLAYIDLATNTELGRIDSATAFGRPVTISYGYYGEHGVMFGGWSYADRTNVLFTVEPGTLAVYGEREMLPGVPARDVTEHDGRMLALVGRSLVYVGAEGQAEETLNVVGLPGYTDPSGLTVHGSTAYVLVRTSAGKPRIYEVQLP